MNKWTLKEVLPLYLGAADKKKQLNILADMMQLSTNQIVNMLKQLGYHPPRVPNYDPRPKQLDNNRVLALYNRGLCDRDIADRLGISANRVRAWRRSHNLALNPAKGKVIDYAKMEELYHMGYYDKQIARQVGISDTQVRRWRLAPGLAPNRVRKKKGK